LELYLGHFLGKICFVSLIYQISEVNKAINRKEINIINGNKSLKTLTNDFSIDQGYPIIW
jgi:hypothetical protein